MYYNDQVPVYTQRRVLYILQEQPITSDSRWFTTVDETGKGIISPKIIDIFEARQKFKSTTVKAVPDYKRDLNYNGGNPACR